MKFGFLASLLLGIWTYDLTGDDALLNYLDWQRSQIPPTPELHFTDHHREAFAANNAISQLGFQLQPSSVGLRSLRTVGQRQNLVEAGSYDLRIVDASDRVYHSNQARTPARINLFRHGPHYIQAHVYDLTPTAQDGETLPIRGELVIHLWGERLYIEAKLHAQKASALKQARLNLTFPNQAETQFVLGNGTEFHVAPQDSFAYSPTKTTWTAITTPSGSVAVSFPEPAGTSIVRTTRSESNFDFHQHFQLPSNSRLEPGHPVSLAHRVHLSPNQNLAAIAQAIATESQPLSADQLIVGADAVFRGYNARAGYYTIGTARPESLRWLYEHPETIATAPLTVRNGHQPRTVAIRHENTATGGRLAAGTLTTPDGHPLPILAQNSKNFSGEHEEPFYDPGDPEYNEHYFLLPLRANETLSLHSHQTFQGWGNHPVKQLGSLQAWMHYYQMSLGVTETTCHVPFRFGGHPGIWIADLRGISGRMWPGRGQPQFDNVGGHRIFHYRDAEGEHFPRYLRSDFRSTGPNLAHFTMDYVTEGNEARIQFEIFEPPQTDVTRSFTRMRVEFDQELHIQDVHQNLKLVSLDTSQQRLRYDTFGYTHRNDVWTVLNPNSTNLPYIAPLSPTAPLVVLSGNRPDSHQEGNNAMLVRKFSARIDGQNWDRLAVGLDQRKGPERVTWITLDADAITFKPGDFIELDFLVIPYGREGDGPNEAFAERERYGFHSPTTTASEGSVINQFPPQVRVTKNQTAAFEIVGGYNVLPIYLEGFPTFIPPTLHQRAKGGEWQAVALGEDNFGHQSYQTESGQYGFVFLFETDGTAREFRVHRETQ